MNVESAQAPLCALTEAYKNIGSIVRNAEEGGEHTMILRFGRPAAVVVPPDWHARAEKVLALMQHGYVLTRACAPMK